MIIDSPIVSGSYAASGSFNQFGDVVISGSLTVTGSIIGTASLATTASFAATASYAANVPITASYALSASQATTASYLSGYVSPFPFTGSAIISGSLGITGSLSVTNFSGSGVRYLVTDASGSVTAQTASAVIKTTQAFTATAGQTTFAVTNGYSTGYVDVFINGSKLNSTEFTDTSGTNIVLATGSFANDIVEVVKYLPASGVSNNVLRQQTVFTASAGQTVFSASYTPGLLDIFLNGSKLAPDDYTANNGTTFTLATASAANDVLDVFVYSYQVGSFSGIGGVGTTGQVAYYSTSNSITGSPNFTISGSTMTVTGSLLVSGSGTFTNIGPAVLSGSVNVSGSLAVGGVNVVLVNQTSSLSVATASFAATASSADNFLARGTITAQTLVVQTITSSVDFVTGSTQFGSRNTDTHTYTGSLAISGSSTVGLNVNNGALFVSSSGNIGIGNTNPQAYTNYVSLTIGDNSASKIGLLKFRSSYNSGDGAEIYQTTGGTLQFAINGSTTVMSISSSNVGIGTASPRGVLDISSGLRTGATNALFIGADSDTSAGTRTNNTRKIGMISSPHYSNTAMPVFGIAMDNQASNNFIYIGGAYSAYNAATAIAFWTGATTASETGTERMRITNVGSVGIGVSSLLSPGGSRRLLQIASGSNGAIIAMGSDTSESNNPRIFSGQYDLGFAAGVTTGTIQFYTNDTERMRITNSGSVGIGITPSAWSAIVFPDVLQVGNGSISNNGSTFTQFANNVYYDGSNYRLISTGGAQRLIYNSDGAIIFENTGSNNADSAITFQERMRITGTGRIGIGTSIPNAVFHVYGSVSELGIQIAKDGSDSVGAGPYIALQNLANTRQYIMQLGASNDLLLNYWGGSGYTERMRIASDGIVVINNGAIVLTDSDTGSIRAVKNTLVNLSTTNVSLSLPAGMSSCAILHIFLRNISNDQASFSVYTGRDEAVLHKYTAVGGGNCTITETSEGVFEVSGLGDGRTYTFTFGTGSFTATIRASSSTTGNTFVSIIGIGVSL